MNGKFESQKERLLSIKQEISLLYQQVNYLLRNEKPLELLDLDVLMNRTHTLYDQLCAINAGDESLDEDLPFDAEALSGLFGGMMNEPGPEPELEPEPEVQPEPEPVAQPVFEPQMEPEPVEEQPVEEFQLVEEAQPVVEEQPVEEIQPVEEEQLIEEEQPLEEEQPIVEEQPVEVFQPVEEAQPIIDEQPVENVEDAVEEKKEETPLGDEYGFFFRFEDTPEKEAQPIEEQTVVRANGKVVHIMEEIPEEDIPERDRVHGDDLVKDNPLEMPKMEHEIFEYERIDSERPESDGLTGALWNDDADFELSTGETLGEKMMGDDHTLANKLQQSSVRDLKSVIGINDKFLFVNELFGGSMEKYNKSIENLNDLKTLNGALIYLNELKIELLWNSSNEAYQKLKELVSRKFES